MEMEYVVGGFLSILVVWIFEISLTWGSHGQSLRGRIGGNYLILFNKDLIEFG